MLRFAAARPGCTRVPRMPSRMASTGPADPARPPKRSLTRTLFLTTIVTPATIFTASIPLAYYVPEFREFVTESLPGGSIVDDLLYDYELQKIDKLAGGNSSIGATADALQHVATNFSRHIKRAEEPKGLPENEASKVTIVEHHPIVGEVVDKSRVTEVQTAHKTPEPKSTLMPTPTAKPAPTAASGPPAAPAAQGSSPVSDKTPVFAKKPRDVTADPVSKPKPNLEPFAGEIPVGHEPPPGYAAPKAPPKSSDAPAQASNPTLALPKLSLDVAQLSEELSRALGSHYVDAINRVTQLLQAEHEAVFQYSVRDGAAVPSEYAQKIHKASADAQNAIQDLLKHIERDRAAKSKSYSAEISSQKKKYLSEAEKAEKEHAQRVAQLQKEAEAKLAKTKQDLQRSGQQDKASELAAQEALIQSRLEAATLELSTADRKNQLKQANKLLDEVRSGRFSNLKELAEQTASLEQIAAHNSKQFASIIDNRRLETALHALDAHAAAGKPVISDLSRIVHLSSEDPLIAAALQSISDSTAYKGAPSFADLSTRFSQSVAPQVRKAALLPEKASPLTHLASSALSFLLFEKHGYPDGDDVESVLARAQFLLDRHDLDAATRQVNSLTGWPKTLAADWLHDARASLELRQAIDILSAHAAARAAKAL